MSEQAPATQTPPTPPTPDQMGQADPTPADYPKDLGDRFMSFMGMDDEIHISRAARQAGRADKREDAALQEFEDDRTTQARRHQDAKLNDQLRLHTAQTLAKSPITDPNIAPAPNAPPRPEDTLIRRKGLGKLMGKFMVKRSLGGPNGAKIANAGTKAGYISPGSLKVNYEDEDGNEISDERKAIRIQKVKNLEELIKTAGYVDPRTLSRADRRKIKDVNTLLKRQERRMARLTDSEVASGAARGEGKVSAVQTRHAKKRAFKAKQGESLNGIDRQFIKDQIYNGKKHVVRVAPRNVRRERNRVLAGGAFTAAMVYASTWTPRADRPRSDEATAKHELKLRDKIAGRVMDARTAHDKLSRLELERIRKAALANGVVTPAASTPNTPSAAPAAPVAPVVPVTAPTPAPTPNQAPAAPAATAPVAPTRPTPANMPTRKPAPNTAPAPATTAPVASSTPASPNTAPEKALSPEALRSEERVTDAAEAVLTYLDSLKSNGATLVENQLTARDKNLSGGQRLYLTNDGEYKPFDRSREKDYYKMPAYITDAGTINRGVSSDFKHLVVDTRKDTEDQRREWNAFIAKVFKKLTIEHEVLSDPWGPKNQMQTIMDKDAIKALRNEWRVERQLREMKAELAAEAAKAAAASKSSTGKQPAHAGK